MPLFSPIKLSGNSLRINQLYMLKMCVVLVSINYVKDNHRGKCHNADSSY